MEKIRIGLTGYGKVAPVHAKAIQDCSNAVLVSVCGRNREKRDRFAAQWDIASRESVAQMVSLDRVDAVIITTPHPRHHDDTIEALEAGCHVLVDKPMAVSVKECMNMIEAAEKASKNLSVISQRRFLPSCLRMRHAVDSGKIGRPAICQVTVLGWRDQAYYESDPWRGKWDTEGGGILINQAVHQIDLMNWFMGPVEEVFGYWENYNHPYIEVEDTSAACIKFKNGGMASVLVSNSQKPGIYAKVHVHGTSGASVGVQTDSGAMFIAGSSGVLEPSVNDLWTIPGEEQLLDKFIEEDREFFRNIDPIGYFFTRQIEDFADAVFKGAKAFLQARTVLRL